MKQWISACGLVVCLMAGAQTAPSVEAPLGGEFKVPRLLVPSQSRVVFYRVNSEPASGVMSVYVNGGYQASLQRGAYTALCLPPSSIEVAARRVENGKDVPHEFDVVNALVLKGGEDVFIRVSEQSNGRPMLQAVRADMALPELVKTREQLHTLPRVPHAVACQDAPAKAEAPKATPKPEPKVKPQSITLAGDAVFPFGKSAVETISPKGRRLLDHLVDRIKTEFGKVEQLKIHIAGHSDGIGTEARNVQLSKERAQAIKDYFVQGGLSAERITVQGRGAQEPVVSCGLKPTASNIACNKPNRRVVVSVKAEAP